VAVPRTARVIASERLAPDTRLVELACAEPLEFVGGQYVIVDSGRVAPTGKPIKRAYSLVSCDADQRRFQLAVKRLGDGGSGSLHDVAPGDEIRFSGPWGKMYPGDGARGATFVLATDTGVSAALGLVQSRRFAPLAARATFIWLRTSADYFLPDLLVCARLPPALTDVHIGELAPIGDPARVAKARALLARALDRGDLGQAFLAGDGAVNYALLDDLVAAGVPATRDHVESFFNMPKKST
jgi:ferredoxin-NADP reductase